MTPLRLGWHAVQRFSRQWWQITPAIVILVACALLPVGRLLELSFYKDGVWALDHYIRMFASPVYLRVLVTTFKIAFFTTVATLCLSYPLAYFIVRMTPRRRNIMMLVIMVSFWASFLIKTFGWMVILSLNGALSQLLVAVGLSDAPLGFLNSTTAVVIGMTHALAPLCVLTMMPVMQSIDQNLCNAGAVHGAKPGSLFWRIYFPLSLPGVTAAVLLVFITALGFFIVPAFLGSRFETVITQVIIEQVQENLNWPFAGALSLLLLTTTLLVFWIYDHLIGLSTLAGSADARADNRKMLGLPATVGHAICVCLAQCSDAIYTGLNAVTGGYVSLLGRMVRTSIISAMMVFFLTPVLIMIPVSFTGGMRMSWPPDGVSLRWYVAVFDSPIWTQAATRSIVVALVSAALALMLGTMAAFAIARRKLPCKTLILAIVLSPLIVPRIIIAVGLFYLYANIGLVGTYSGLVVGHAILALPYVVITVIAVLKNYDSRLDQAAWSLGARPIQALRKITLPLIGAGLLSAFLFAVITSFDELTIALFVTGGLTTTLPKQMWDDAFNVATPTLAALSTLILVFVTAMTFAGNWLQNRK